MHVPRAWFKAEGTPEARADEEFTPSAWGWGDDEAEARGRAGERLRRIVERMRGAKSSDDEYEYDAHPLREEILQDLGPQALLTRNRYGAVVLNAAGLLVLDVDLPPASAFQLLGRLFTKRDPAAEALARLRTSLREAAPATTFRLYRTAAGLRALALDREFDPAGEEAHALMQRTGTDKAFAHLCKKQKSFRARLTPKPWRCACPNPPGEHPRAAGPVRERFTAWCERYARAVERYATCRYLATVGTSPARPEFAPLIELHDRASRCDEPLPLA